MSLRSSLTKLVGSLPSLRIRPTWAGAAGVVGFMAMSASGCNCGNSSLVPCGDAGEFCVCNGLECQVASRGTGGAGGASGTGGSSTSTSSGGGLGGAGGSTTSSSGSGGGAGGATATSSTAASSSSSSGVVGLACNKETPCPEPQKCLADGYCHYPCTDLLECKQIDNRFVACVGGFCD